MFSLPPKPKGHVVQQITNADRIRFCDIAQPTLLKLAQYLDGRFEGNWQYLAESLDCHPTYVQVCEVLCAMPLLSSDLVLLTLLSKMYVSLRFLFE